MISSCARTLRLSQWFSIPLPLPPPPACTHVFQEWVTFQKAVDRMLVQVYKYTIPGYRHLFFLPDNVQFAKDRNIVKDKIGKLVQEMRARPTPPAEDTSVWAQLIRLTNHETKAPATDADIFGETFTMLV